MKTLTLSLICLLFSTLAEAQSASDLLLINQDRQQLNQKSMLILGGWAVGNIGFSGAMMTQTEGSQFYFHQMNVAWNAVNLTLAGVGYFSAKRADISSYNLSKTVTEQYKIQKILLLNTGLDVAYMAGGLYFLERSKVEEDNAEQWKGYGQSLILQGGFLFVFDIFQYYKHAKRNKVLNSFFENTEIQVGNGIGIRYSF